MTVEYARELACPSAAVEESRASYRADGEAAVFDIRETIGILRKSNTGWTRELNVVAWNGGSPRFDIRDWDPLHEKMGKGITFTKAEADQICKWFAVRGTDLVPSAGADSSAADAAASDAPCDDAPF